MREHTILRVMFLWMVLLTFMNANPQAIKMGEDMGDPDPCRNIKTINNDHECFRRNATGPTMGVSKDPMNKIHLIDHHTIGRHINIQFINRQSDSYFHSICFLIRNKDKSEQPLIMSYSLSTI